MSDPSERDETLGWLWGRSVAHEMLLRGLFARLASEHSDPAAWIFETIEQLVASMDAHPSPAPAVTETAVAELRLFAEQVRIRLLALAVPPA